MKLFQLASFLVLLASAARAAAPPRPAGVVRRHEMYGKDLDYGEPNDTLVYLSTL